MDTNRKTAIIVGVLFIIGTVAIILHLITGVLILFGVQSGFSTSNIVMNFPIFLQEMVMAVWLIVKGFNPSAIASGSVKQI